MGALEWRRPALEGRSLFFLIIGAMGGVGRDALGARRGALPWAPLEIPAVAVDRYFSDPKMCSLILFCELVRFPRAFTVGHGHKISLLSSVVC